MSLKILYHERIEKINAFDVKIFVTEGGLQELLRNMKSQMLDMVITSLINFSENYQCVLAKS